jgi:hypothetical protein
VAQNDPAIDHDNSDWKAYGEWFLKKKGSWREYIKPLDGQQITEFVIGVIPSSELSRISDEFGDAMKEEAQWKCFLYGLRDINGWPGDVPKVKKGGIEYVDPVWISKTFIRGLRQTGLLVGFAAWVFNQMTAEEIKN